MSKSGAVLGQYPKSPSPKSDQLRRQREAKYEAEQQRQANETKPKRKKKVVPK